MNTQNPSFKAAAALAKALIANDAVALASVATKLASRASEFQAEAFSAAFDQWAESFGITIENVPEGQYATFEYVPVNQAEAENEAQVRREQQANRETLAALAERLKATAPAPQVAEPVPQAKVVPLQKPATSVTAAESTATTDAPSADPGEWLEE